MILINKDLSVQNLVLTLTELTTVSNPVYLLVLQGGFTKTTYRFILQENLSPNLNRFDLFSLSTSLFQGLENGLYSYQVYQSATVSYDETLLGDAIETGTANVTAPAEITTPIIYNSETSEYLVYNSND